MTPHDDIRARRRKDRESGQAMVEFALILVPLLLLVAGIIQFGIGLNYWLDMQRLANQGARWAVVNNWPGCLRTAAAGSCTATPACTAAPTSTTLVHYLECQAVSRGLENSVTATLCAPDDLDASTTNGSVGTPIRVRLDAPFKFVPLLRLGTINLRADATMRIENNVPNHLGTPATC